MNSANPYRIVEITEALCSAVQPLVNDSWSGPFIAVNGKLWDTRLMPGFAALDAGGAVIGYVLYTFHDGECEIMVLESLRENIGIGTTLIERVKLSAKEHRIQKVVLMTTNDNIRAIRFYQKRGFTLRALRPNMLEISRKLKPEIPLESDDGIPLRDEIEFEIDL
jgi:ribosomal protein S18 acetylase RimI-like enzyme